MFDLVLIKQHLDRHGVGCAVRGDHVAIALHWTSPRLDGGVRHLETTLRVRTIEEAIAAIGCPCPPATSGPERTAPGVMAA